MAAADHEEDALMGAILPRISLSALARTPRKVLSRLADGPVTIELYQRPVAVLMSVRDFDELRHRHGHSAFVPEGIAPDVETPIDRTDGALATEEVDDAW